MSRRRRDAGDRRDAASCVRGGAFSIQCCDSGDGTTQTELAGPFEMSQFAISRRLKVLERAGLVDCGDEKQGRPATPSHGRVGPGLPKPQRGKALSRIGQLRGFCRDKVAGQ